MSHSTESSMQTSRPWWRFPHVWLVVAGPAIVVVASFVTFYLAARSADPVLSTSADSQTNAAHGPNADISQAPAMQARNHAATGVLPARDQTQKP
jgi:uncharacterized protein